MSGKVYEETIALHSIESKLADFSGPTERRGAIQCSAVQSKYVCISAEAVFNNINIPDSVASAWKRAQSYPVLTPALAWSPT